jgi:hypothetical protein
VDQSYTGSITWANEMQRLLGSAGLDVVRQLTTHTTDGAAGLAVALVMVAGDGGSLDLASSLFSQVVVRSPFGEGALYKCVGLNLSSPEGAGGGEGGGERQYNDVYFSSAASELIGLSEVNDSTCSLHVFKCSQNECSLNVP